MEDFRIKVFLRKEDFRAGTFGDILVKKEGQNGRIFPNFNWPTQVGRKVILIFWARIWNLKTVKKGFLWVIRRGLLIP